MATHFACPGCATPFDVTDELAGKRAKCPKCAMIFTVPAPSSARDAAVVPAVLPVDLFGNDPDEERQPKRKKRRVDNDDYDDRDEPRPRRAAKPAKSQSGLVWALVLGGAGLFLFLVCGGVIAVVAVLIAGNRPPAPVAGMPPPVPNNPFANLPATRIQLVNGVFTTRAQLVFNDPADPKDARYRCKLFQIDLQPGRQYQIDMQSQAFDSFLRLENAQGVEVASDDDGGGNFDARILFTVNQPGTYTIVATTFAENTFGPFTLTVRDNNAGVGAPKGGPMKKGGPFNK